MIPTGTGKPHRLTGDCDLTDDGTMLFFDPIDP
jgi:hypothetical protein